jgi:hypothetical protein
MRIIEFQDLLVTQKDALFKILSENGFNPKDFTWEKQDGIPTLVYRFDNYFCAFYISENPFSRKVVCSPGKSLIKEDYHGSLDIWQSYEQALKEWLTNLKREKNAEYLWGKINDVSVKIRQDINDEKFTSTEKEIIFQKFERIKLEIKNVGLKNNEYTEVKNQLDHLLELTEKLGKRDWLGILIGSFASLFLTLTMTPENVKTIWDIIKFHFENWFILPK